MKIIKNSDVTLREIHSTYFLINVKEKYWESKSIVKINEVGKTIWQLLDSSLDFDQLLTQIISIFDIALSDVEMVRQDIQAFLDNLYALGYIIYE